MVEGLALRRRWGERPSRSRGWGPLRFYYIGGASISRMRSVERAELISVGTELLLGEIVDTNSAYLATDLARRGVDVLWSARVGDNLGRIRHLIEQGLERSDLVVLGGGLGPTEDDLTRDAVAAALGEEQTL